VRSGRLFETIVQSLSPVWQAFFLVGVGVALVFLGRTNLKSPRNLFNAAFFFGAGIGFIALGIFIFLRR